MENTYILVILVCFVKKYVTMPIFILDVVGRKGESVEEKNALKFVQSTSKMDGLKEKSKTSNIPRQKWLDREDIRKAQERFLFSAIAFLWGIKPGSHFKIPL